MTSPMPNELMNIAVHCLTIVFVQCRQPDGLQDSTCAAQIVSMATVADEFCSITAEQLLVADDQINLSAADLASMADAFDGRLLVAAATCPIEQRPLGLASHVMAHADALMATLGLDCSMFHLPGQPETHASSAAPAIGSAAPAAADGGYAATALTAQVTEEPEDASELNPLAASFLGPEARTLAMNQSDKAEFEHSLHEFDDRYHWHSGTPIEPSYLGETNTGKRVAQWLDCSLQELLHCPLLYAGMRKMIAQVLQQCENKILLPNPAERAGRLQVCLDQARQVLLTYEARQNQMQARAMKIYATSLQGSKYASAARSSSGPKSKQQKGGGGSAAPAQQQQQKGSSAAGKKPKKLSKAQQIIQDNSAQQASREAARLLERWRQLQKELEAEVRVQGWGSSTLKRVQLFLSKCEQAPGSYLAASLFKLQQAEAAWKATCMQASRSQQKQALEAAHDQAGSQDPLKALLKLEDGRAHEHAVTMWMTVQDLLSRCGLQFASYSVREISAFHPKRQYKRGEKLTCWFRGLLPGGETSEEEAACKAAAASMRLLGFKEAAAALQPPRVSSSNKKGTQGFLISKHLIQSRWHLLDQDGILEDMRQCVRHA